MEIIFVHFFFFLNRENPHIIYNYANVFFFIIIIKNARYVLYVYEDVEKKIIYNTYIQTNKIRNL